MSHTIYPFLDALVRDGKATMVCAQGLTTLIVAGQCATGRTFNLDDVLATWEKMAKEIAKQSLLKSLDNLIPDAAGGPSIYENEDAAIRYVAEKLGLFADDLEVLPELRSLAADLSPRATTPAQHRSRLACPPPHPSAPFAPFA